MMRLVLLTLSTLSLALAHPKLILDAGNNQISDQITLSGDTIPPPPAPEPIDVFELPLPPVAPNSLEGSCTPDLNPHATGCINQTTNLQSGSFTIDNNHVTSVVEFVGSSNDSIYSGLQIIIIKTDNTTFPNGDAWKCLTCGVPPESAINTNAELSYPQAFRDGKRLLAGPNIIDCGQYDLTSDECTPSELHIYPIHWAISTDPSSPSGPMRELRIHPDDTHLAWSSFTPDGGQLCYLGRLNFNPSPSSSSPANTTTDNIPLPPHYSLTHINLLISPSHPPPLTTNLTTNSSSLTLHSSTSISIGEARGFSGTGTELTYLGYPHESSNIDVFAINLHSGVTRRLTSHPEYVDPVDISPDDAWTVVMDTRDSGRQMFMSGMRGVPAVTDLLSIPVVASVRNNGARRFFQPYIIDQYGDRGEYFGQRVNGAGDGGPGAVNDENWNGLADPKWSFDGTRIVYHQGIVEAPACGGGNPLVCPVSTAEGGRTKRVMVARLRGRRPVPEQKIVAAPDVVPWAMPYVPGQKLPNVPFPPLEEGTYTLTNTLSGHASVTISYTNISSSPIPTISLVYTSYISPSFPHLVLSGTESISLTRPNSTTYRLHWFSNLTQQDTVKDIVNRKVTGEEGFTVEIDVMKNLFWAEGWLKTLVDGVWWGQPGNGM